VHFPKFWAKGKAASATVWRWSDASLEDAQQQAAKRAQELAAIFASGRKLDRYSYGDRPVREEIIQTLSPEAVITRNVYGALVLNAARAMFIDVDGDDRLDELRSWAGNHPELGVRIYRTAAGLRALVTNRTFEPKSDEATSLLAEAGSDPLYVRLCQIQESFRARLTPKPWRVGIRPSKVRWPFETPEQKASLQHWVGNYDMASQQASVCELVETVGPSAVAPEIQPILELHDKLACGSRPLA
jgi:hypothetical protein